MHNLKIITAFHGAVLRSNAFKEPEVYIPVYGGRSVTTYLPDQSKKMLADNTGDNISWMNPFIGEFTCIYWAAKHLHELGDPDYIGLNHYRRLFPISKYIQQIQKQESFVLTSAHPDNLPVMHAAELEYGIQDELEELFQQILWTQEEKQIFEEFKKQSGYPEKNLFVIPTKELPGYIEFMMRAVKLLYRDFQYQAFEGLQYRRKPARLLEFITAYYLIKLTMSGYTRLVVNYEYPWGQFT